MDIDQVPSKITKGITHGLEGVRDRTADVVAADGGSVFREINKLSRRIGKTEDRLSDRIDTAEDSILDRVDTMIAGNRRTTWPRRIFWLALGVGAGMAAAYFADPDRGRARRAQLQDQATARTREVTEQVTTQAKMAADKARGAAIEEARDRMPDIPEEDPYRLEQRIKSEVFGHREDTQQVVIKVDGPGTVALKGTVPSATSETELLAAVAEVDGVIDVTSELAVRSR
jgi:gas vesicle protein